MDRQVPTRLRGNRYPQRRIGCGHRPNHLGEEGPRSPRRTEVRGRQIPEVRRTRDSPTETRSDASPSRGSTTDSAEDGDVEGSDDRAAQPAVDGHVGPDKLEELVIPTGIGRTVHNWQKESQYPQRRIGCGHRPNHLGEEGPRSPRRTEVRGRQIPEVRRTRDSPTETRSDASPSRGSTTDSAEDGDVEGSDDRAAQPAVDGHVGPDKLEELVIPTGIGRIVHNWQKESQYPQRRIGFIFESISVQRGTEIGSVNESSPTDTIVNQLSASRMG